MGGRQAGGSKATGLRKLLSGSHHSAIVKQARGAAEIAAAAEP
jgi:hypothetical protein